MVSRHAAIVDHHGRRRRGSILFVTMMVSVMSSSMVLISIQTQSSAITISSIDRLLMGSCNTRLTEIVKASRPWADCIVHGQRRVQCMYGQIHLTCRFTSSIDTIVLVLESRMRAIMDHSRCRSISIRTPLLVLTIIECTSNRRR